MVALNAAIVELVAVIVMMFVQILDLSAAVVATVSEDLASINSLP